ncbi:MAG: 30S ribosomal protein S3 [Candidatus Woykebacteria bacterium GWB1_45_5]|uniref:Small ribosomal subunit protein uS3 n=2 Tax=Candidatus Woykeibacteriota TaxID=1817899 RepID=A0A1G1W2K8_9BACT|nr:MAG: 30S ribosomal protein S3 [Candidatus Woykebacteria bacterium GWA1_44_8]OGY23327.1 MAG: 30S ribosomal protein S3 [Candidatus Woykebacteria bacterium GWB1_45_5]
MGQKVNPKVARLVINRNWSSRWFAGDDRKYQELLLADVKIRNLIMGRLKAAGISKVIIERSAGKININVRVARPGMVIGRGGSGVEELKKAVEKEIGQKVSLNIEEIKTPDLDAYLVARGIADQIERRFSVKRVMLQTIDRVIGAGAAGVKIICSGRIGGKEIARSEKGARGSIPTSTLRANIDFAKVDAKTATAGVVGVKVWIHKKEKG